ncbi:MAG: IS5 family transposase [Stellaceae bacterium]
MSKRFSADTAPEFPGATPGGWKNTHRRFSRWAKRGCGTGCLSTWPPTPTTNTRLLDSTIVRAHQPSAGAPKKDDNQAIGRSKGGLSTKIHALVDALGNPLGFLLTPGQVHDLAGADALLPQMDADVLIADKAYDADDRVVRPLASTGKSEVIPPRQNRTAPRQFDGTSTRHAI